MKGRAFLQKIENDRKITKDSDSEFLFEHQRALLLALKEAGILTEMQYRHAEVNLKDQHRAFVKERLSREGKDGGKNT